MKTPQVTPDWTTGIYIGDGRIARRRGDDELRHALRDIRETMRHHELGSPYHTKLLRDYDDVLEEMGQSVADEYAKQFRG